MKKVITLFRFVGIISVLIFSIYSIKYFSPQNTLPVIDTTMAQQVLTAATQNKQQFNQCEFSSQTQQLQPSDPYALKRYELTLSYNGSTVANIKNGFSSAPNLKGIYCIQENSYTYMILDTLSRGLLCPTESKTCDPAYIAFSSDNGKQWSEVMSLSQLAENKFTSVNHNLNNMQLLGDSRDFAIALYNIRDRTTYLFDPEFKLFKKVTPAFRIGDFEQHKDFFFFDGTLYLSENACAAGSGQCNSEVILETSKDYGKMWHKITFPGQQDSYFFEYDNKLYQIFKQPCNLEFNALSIFPAFDRSYVCGILSLRVLKDDGLWAAPKTLPISTVDKLLAVYHDEKGNPIFVWIDYRSSKPKICGMIPLIGCVDSGPFETPYVLFAGKLDIDKLTLEQKFIYAGYLQSFLDSSKR